MMYVKQSPEPTKTSMRQAYGLALSELAKQDERIVIIDDDISSPPRGWFEQNAPERLFSTGLTEANSIAMAAGLAAEGKIPFWFNMSFLLTIAYSQLRQSVAEDRRNVKIICYAAGVSGTGGRSHNYVEDIALMRSIPNFVVMAPADTVELTKMIKTATEYDGPMYLRFPRDPPLPTIFQEDYPFELGKAVWVKEGKDAMIISTGNMTSESMLATTRLAEQNLDVGIIHSGSIKPIDMNIIPEVVSSARQIFTIEDHSIIGGLGEAVSSIAAQLHPAKIIRLGVNDAFCSSVQFDGRKYYGLDSEGIAKTIANTLRENI